MSETATDSDLQLLTRYTRDRAEDAFAEIVRRHLDLVHSAALRQVRSPQLAEEVAQSVFTDLARNAHRLAPWDKDDQVKASFTEDNPTGRAPDTILTAWLYQVTRRTAIDVVRREARRQLREQIAFEMNTRNAIPYFAKYETESTWASIEPLLDEAMSALDDTDRAAVLLRYFENKSLREVGATLGTSDDAAQKRVSRAVERLREFFAKRGVTVGASGLVVVISANAVQAAPVGLAATLSSASLALATTGSGIFTFIKFMTLTKLQLGIIGVIVITSLVTPLMIQQQAQARLMAQDKALRQRADRMARLWAENQRSANLLAEAKNPPSLPDDQFGEILRLRGEIGLLRTAVHDLAQLQTNAPRSRNDMLTSMAKKYAARIDQLKQLLETNPSEKIPELQYLTDRDWLNLAQYETFDTEDDHARAMSNARYGAEMNFASGVLDKALHEYVQSNNGQFPTDLAQLKHYFKSPVDDAVLQRWQILPGSNLKTIVDEDWVITQKVPVNLEFDQRIFCGMKTVQLGYDGTNQWH